MNKFGYTVIGPRKINEDFYGHHIADDTGIFAIADGVGGNNCGEYASKFCTETFIEIIKKEENDNVNLENILYQVNEKLLDESFKKTECNGMATTFIGLYIQNKTATMIHVGDSRLYLLRGNGLKQLSEDHTEARRLRTEGLLSFEQAKIYHRKHILDSALGITGKLIITQLTFGLELNDRLLLLTDGCYDVFSKVELRDLSVSKRIFEDFCYSIQSELDGKRLKDNATFLAIQI